MESIVPPGPAPGYKALRRTEEIHRNCFAESSDRTASRYGTQWSCKPQGLPGSSPAGGIFPDRIWRRKKGRIRFRTRPSSKIQYFHPTLFQNLFSTFVYIKIALCYEKRTRSITLPFPAIYLPAASGIAMHTRTINNVIPTTGQSGTVNGTII